MNVPTANLKLLSLLTINYTNRQLQLTNRAKILTLYILSIKMRCRQYVCISFFIGDLMYKTLAQKITSFFIQKKIIKEEDKEIYEYGYEVLFSETIYIVIMFIISLVTNTVFESLIFFLGFYMFRKFAGGYHANTYVKCHIIFAINQILFLFLLFKTPLLYRDLLAFFSIIITLIITFLYAPIDHPNKPFNSKEFSKYKKQSRTFILISFLIITLIYILNKNNILVFCFSIGVLSAGMSLLYTVLERRLHNEKI